MKIGYSAEESPASFIEYGEHAVLSSKVSRAELQLQASCLITLLPLSIWTVLIGSQRQEHSAIASGDDERACAGGEMPLSGKSEEIREQEGGHALHSFRSLSSWTDN